MAILATYQQRRRCDRHRPVLQLDFHRYGACTHSIAKRQSSSVIATHHTQSSTAYRKNAAHHNHTPHSTTPHNTTTHHTAPHHTPHSTSNHTPHKASNHTPQSASNHTPHSVSQPHTTQYHNRLVVTQHHRIAQHHFLVDCRASRAPTVGNNGGTRRGEERRG